MLGERLARSALDRSGSLAARLPLAHALSWLGRGPDADRVLTPVDPDGLSEWDLTAWTVPKAANQFWMLDQPEAALNEFAACLEKNPERDLGQPPFGAVGGGGEGPVGSGQQAAGVLAGVDPGGADPGGFQHGDGGGLHAGGGQWLRLVGVGVEEQGVVWAGRAAEGLGLSRGAPVVVRDRTDQP